MLSQLEGCGRSYRAGNNIYPAKSLIKIPFDQCTHFLRLSVIGIIIASREGVSAKHDATLHFGTKANAARSAIHLP